MSYKNRKPELSIAWMDISDDDAMAVAEEVAAEINAELPKHLPAGVTLRDDITANTVLVQLCNDRPWWNQEEQAPSLYLPINYLVNYAPGTRNLVTSSIDLFDIAGSVRIVSIGDTVLLRNSMAGPGGEGPLIKIETQSGVLSMTVDGYGWFTSVDKIMGNKIMGKL